MDGGKSPIMTLDGDEKDVTIIIEKALNNQSDSISLRMKHKLTETATDKFVYLSYDYNCCYLKFRELDFYKILKKSGFKKEKIEMIRIPNYDTTPESEFCSVAKGNESLRRDHGNGAVWFTFGAPCGLIDL